MNSAARPKLRTKTGCLICRHRRKKCDESFPICSLCSSSGRNCIWPSPNNLLDRRYSSYYGSKRQAKGPSTKDEPDNNNYGDRHLPAPAEDGMPSHPLSGDSLTNVPITNSICPLDLVSEATISHGIISRDLEHSFSRHFADKYFSLLLLPSCYRGFHDGWLIDIQQLMLTHESLYYSVLACAASHIFLSNSSWEVQDLALTYYSKALKELASLIASVPKHEDHDGLLMSVMLLYLHGSLGWGTDNDIPRHINAATQIVTSRLFQRPVGIQTFFDRLAIESVVYQQFLVTASLWSDTTGSTGTYNSEFWDNAEKLLDQSILLYGAPKNLNSPILGVPVSLFRITLILRQCYRTGNAPNSICLDQMRNEVAVWEGRLLCDQDLSTTGDASSDELDLRETIVRDETYLHALIASLQLDQLSCGDQCNGLPLMVDRDTWQIRMSLQILMRHWYDPVWPRSYIKNWPVYSLGLFMSSPEDRQIIREDLTRSWESTRTSQVKRFSRDLEEIWGGSC